ncbi:MAG TPA: SRPBCC family protein [Actinomycetota bacterium]|nr:SRPBCC family protein [Actinomycetota bacterium]
MVEVRVEAATSLPPEAIVAAATDFSERRPEIWADLDPNVYLVESLGDREAVVTEGSKTFGGIQARESYDWSRTGVVRSQVIESNVFAPGSWWELRVSPADGGGSRVEWTSHRIPHGAKGHILTATMRVMGARYLSRYLRTTLADLESASGHR